MDNITSEETQMLLDEITKELDTLDQAEHRCEAHIRELSYALEKQYVLLHYINVCRSRLIADYSLRSEEAYDE